MTQVPSSKSIHIWQRGVHSVTWAMLTISVGVSRTVFGRVLLLRALVHLVFIRMLIVKHSVLFVLVPTMKKVNNQK